MTDNIPANPLLCIQSACLHCLVLRIQFPFLILQSGRKRAAGKRGSQSVLRTDFTNWMSKDQPSSALFRSAILQILYRAIESR